MKASITLLEITKQNLSDLQLCEVFFNLFLC